MSLWPASPIARLTIALFWGTALLFVIVGDWSTKPEPEVAAFLSTTDEVLTGWQPAMVVPRPEPLPDTPTINSKLVVKKQKTLDYWNRMIQIGNELGHQKM